MDLLVVHAISLPPGAFGGTFIEDFFLGRLDVARHPFFREIASLRVAAHFVIDRAGDVVQFVPVLARAWHAGESVWEGRRGCNDYAVGVELEGDEKTPFTAAQYETLAGLTRTLQDRLPALTDERIVGHEHVSPGRKWDPGPRFSWDRFRVLLAQTPPGSLWPLVWEEGA